MGHTTRALGTAGTLLLAVCCGADRRDAATGGGAISGFRRVKAAHEAFVTAGKALAEAEARGGTADSDALRAARARFDTAYERDQKTLAVFLTVAVNEWPNARETREALALYATSAVANARLLLDRGGDPGHAVEMLEGAGYPFRVLGLPPPPELVTSLAEARRRQAN